MRHISVKVQRVLLSFAFVLALASRGYSAPELSGVNPAVTSAAPIPALFELGIFGGYGYIPDYPASDQNSHRFILLPYFIYRGNVVRSDREGMRAKLIRSERVDLELSFAGAFPVNSSDNRARRGMPDLDYTGEIGPRLAITLSKFQDRGRLRILVPVRAVFSSDFKTNFTHRGYDFAPTLALTWFDFLHRDWTAVFQTVSNFGNRQLQGYFYDVDAQFASSDRPYFRAREGYLGVDVFNGLAIPIGNHFRIFNGIQVSFHQGAANQASPLFRQETNFVYVVGVSYILFESHHRGTEVN